MPDAHGNFKGLAMSPKANAAWERCFGARTIYPTDWAPEGQTFRDLMLYAPTPRSHSAKFTRDSDTMGPPSSSKESTPHE